MKLKYLILALLCSSLLHAANGHHTLTVEAKGFKNNKGEVQFSLYNKDGSIPDKKLNQYFKMKRVYVKNGEAKAIFTDLPDGKYAVSLYHDENNNHKIDKGMMLPEEGVGLTNFKTINFFNVPNFKAASFTLDKNSNIKMDVIYF
jgi:uncharacterized protein (DUF2141 family)